MLKEDIKISLEMSVVFLLILCKIDLDVRLTCSLCVTLQLSLLHWRSSHYTVRTCAIKIVTFNDKSDFSYYKELLIKERICSQREANSFL